MNGRESSGIAFAANWERKLLSAAREAALRRECLRSNRSRASGPVPPVRSRQRPRPDQQQRRNKVGCKWARSHWATAREWVEEQREHVQKPKIALTGTHGILRPPPASSMNKPARSRLVRWALILAILSMLVVGVDLFGAWVSGRTRELSRTISDALRDAKLVTFVEFEGASTQRSARTRFFSA
jgi:hypothetical protein